MNVHNSEMGSAVESEVSTGLIGAVVCKKASLRPERTTLQGRFVQLAPLDVKAHLASLLAVTQQSESLWRYLPYGPFPNVASFEADIEQKAGCEDPLFFAIVDQATRQAVGHAAFLRITPEHLSIEVGHILYAPILQRTAGATEAMYLMAKYAFDVLGYRRYEWKCNALNAASRKAALRLGFVFEGLFRQHMIVKGRNRDTAWFSMLDSEWPARRSAFESWLEPSNFDSAGQQRAPLLTFAERQASVRPTPTDPHCRVR